MIHFLWFHSLGTLSALPFALSSLQIPLIQPSSYALNISRVNETIASFMTTRSIPGLSLAITKENTLLHAAGYGLANISTDEPVTTTHRFRQASVSKSVTSIAIMRLIQDGLLDIDDTVFGTSGILGTQFGSKPFGTWETQITVRHLLEHSSGFVDEEMCGKECDPTYLPKWLQLDQWELVTAILDAYDPTHEPGTFASYSNFGYFILGRIVEAVSGVKPYAAFIKEKVLEPFVNVTEMEIAANPPGEDEVAYYANSEQEEDEPYSFHVSRRDSVGAWIARPLDLVKITTALEGSGRLLNKDMSALMFEESDVVNSSYAKGWTVDVSEEDGSIIEARKDGGYPGTSTWIGINFVNRTTWAIAVNMALVKNETLGWKGGYDLKDLVDEILGWIE